MKKILSILLLFFVLLSFTTSSAFAKNLKMIAETINDFSTLDKTKHIELKIIGDYKVSEEAYVPSGLILNGEITEISSAKRGKRDAYAYMKITSFKLPNDSEFKTFSSPQKFSAKLSKHKKLDIKDKSLDLGASAAGLFVDNITYPINFVRGAVIAKEGENRLAAGAKMTYEKSMFSYFSKGKELILPAGSQLTLTLKAVNY